MLIIKKLSCFKKQSKIHQKETNNLKLLNILVVKYFGSGLVVMLGGFLTENKIDGFFIMRIFCGVYLAVLLFLFFVKDRTKQRLISL